MGKCKNAVIGLFREIFCVLQNELAIVINTNGMTVRTYLLWNKWQQYMVEN